MDIPRNFNVIESAHRIHSPFAPEKPATLGAALRLEAGTRVLDPGSGSGEMLCTWARDHGVVRTGVHLSALFTGQANLRRWLEGNPDDDLANDVRARLTSEPERYAAHTREYLGWGVFALMTR